MSNDKIFRNNKFPDMYSETILNFNEPINVLRQNKFEVKNNISPITTLKCILDNYSADKKIIALNFANAMYAGGGYILGGSAQEESLCRASMLYYTIKTQKRFYIKNRLHILPDYTDTMIYSHNVPLIRNENSELLDKFMSCDFITCPAVNRTFAKFIFSDKNINNKMSVRIKRIISLAVSENPDIIILGAFGCGAFGNKRETIYKIFEDTINAYIPDNIKVIFAVV